MDPNTHPTEDKEIISGNSTPVDTDGKEEATEEEVLTPAQILMKYSAGEYTLEECNERLKEVGCDLRLDPFANALTEEEIANTTIGTYPSQANGWGLLDTGTGTKNKVEVHDGKLVNCDCGNMFALLIIAGRMYEVKGVELVDYEKK